MSKDISRKYDNFYSIHYLYQYSCVCIIYKYHNALVSKNCSHLIFAAQGKQAEIKSVHQQQKLNECCLQMCKGCLKHIKSNLSDTSHYNITLQYDLKLKFIKYSPIMTQGLRRYFIYTLYNVCNSKHILMLQ